MSASFEPAIPRQDDLERLKLEADIAFRKLEVAEKQRDLRKSSGFLGNLNITVTEATLIIGVLGFFGTMAGSYLQQGAQMELKKQSLNLS